MPLPSRSWTVSCRACDLVVGVVEDGRFVHEQACTSPLAIGAGLLRCCQCGGPLAGDPRPLVEGEAYEADPVAQPLPFRRPALNDGEVRKRL
jgi:hypothetical protein